MPATPTPCSDASIETVDLTLPLVKLFNQDPRMLKMVAEIGAQAPIPFEQLGLDPRM